MILSQAISKSRPISTIDHLTASDHSSLDKGFSLICLILSFYSRTVQPSDCPLLQPVNEQMGQLMVNKTRMMMQSGFTLNCQWLIAASVRQVGFSFDEG